MRSPRVSPEMAAHIKFLVRAKGLFQHQVAALLSVNQGRISEVMTGKIHAEIHPEQDPFPV